MPAEVAEAKGAARVAEEAPAAQTVKPSEVEVRSKLSQGPTVEVEAPGPLARLGGIARRALRAGARGP